MDVLRLGMRVWDHKIDEFTHPARVHEARQEDTGFRKIHLLTRGCLHRANPEKATPVPVENSCENTGGVELRKAAPVNGTISANQSHGMEISNRSVILNWFVAVGSGMSFASFRFLHTFASELSEMCKLRP